MASQRKVLGRRAVAVRPGLVDSSTAGGKARLRESPDSPISVDSAAKRDMEALAMELDNKLELSRDSDNVVNLPSPRSTGRPSGDLPSPDAPSRSSPSRDAAVPNMKRRLRRSQDSSAPKPPASALPLLMDPRILRGPCETTLAEAAAVPPVALRVQDEQAASPLSALGCLEDVLPWPETFRSGGTTCAGPRNAGHINPCRKNPKHLPMGEVLLLGAGMRPLASTPGMSQQPHTATVVGSELVSSVRNEEQSGFAMPQSVQTPEATPLSTEGEHRNGTDSKAEKSESVHDDLVEQYLHPFDPVKGIAEVLAANKQGIGGTSGPLQEALLATAQEMPPLIDQQEICREDEVSTQEVALQTVTPWTDYQPRGLDVNLMEEQRFLIMPRCDPKQVNLASWKPIEKPSEVASPEMCYLSHVRSRFPGTIDSGCRLQDRGCHRRCISTPHANLLRRRLAPCTPGSPWTTRVSVLSGVASMASTRTEL